MQKLEKSDDSKRHSDFKLLVNVNLAEIEALTDLISKFLKDIDDALDLLNQLAPVIIPIGYMLFVTFGP